MLRTIFTLIGLLILVFTSHSQLYVAPKIGLNGLAEFKGDDGVNFNVNEGYQFGAEVGYTLFQIIGLKTSLMYSNRQFTQTADQILTTPNDEKLLFTERINIKNGSLQFNGGFQISMGESFEFNIGPQLDLLMASKGTGVWDFENGVDSTSVVNYDYQNDDAGEGAYWNFDEKEGNYFQNAFLGINIGIGFQLVKNMFLELRTNYGVSDFLNDFYQNESNKLQTREFDIIMTASYRIPIKKSRKQKEEEIKDDLFDKI